MSGSTCSEGARRNNLSIGTTLACRSRRRHCDDFELEANIAAEGDAVAGQQININGGVYM